MRDGLDHRWAGKHADSSADPHADSHADSHPDARTVDFPVTIQPITIKRARAITVRATRADTNPDSESFQIQILICN